MNIRKFGLAALLISMSPMAAIAQEPAAITTGMEVRGPDDTLVGTVKSADGEFVTVATDKHEARLPKASFTPHEGKLLFGLTRDQLNAEVDKAAAASAAAIAPGATVVGSAGATVGTIETVEGDLVTLKLQSGKMVRLPRSSVGVGPNGPVIGMTAAEIEAAAG